METPENKIQIQRKLINELKIQTSLLNQRIGREKKLLEIMCNDFGHDFVKESDYDYHRPTYYLKCVMCGFTKNWSRRDESN